MEQYFLYVRSLISKFYWLHFEQKCIPVNHVNPSLVLLQKRVGNRPASGCAPLPQGSSSNLSLWLFSALPPTAFFRPAMGLEMIRTGKWTKKACKDRDYLSQPFFTPVLCAVQKPACPSFKIGTTLLHHAKLGWAGKSINF